jgi:integrase
MKVESTNTPYLARAVPSGIYYARIRIQRRLKWRSLDTDVFTTAKLRLPDKLTEIRRALSKPTRTQIDSNTTFSEAMEVYKRAVNASDIKDRAKEFRLRAEFTLRRTWKPVFERTLRNITEEDLNDFLSRFRNGLSVYRPPNSKGKTRAGNSATSVNSLITFFQNVFKVGVDGGILAESPAAHLPRMKQPKKDLRPLTTKQYADLIAHIRRTAGWGRKVADLVEGLTYTGMRIDESRRLTWGHLDFQRGLITIPGDKTESSFRTNPMLPDFKALIKRMAKVRKFANEDKIFEAKEAIESLRSACRAIDVPRLTHHDLRHLFATKCIEKGVPIPTVATWLGHNDGGVLAMRTYRHYALEHGMLMAKKVSFK